MGTITTVAAVTGGLVENQSLASNTLAASAITASSTIMATGAISASNFSGSSSGTNTGDQTITLTSDVTGSGTGSIVTTIAAGAVTLSKMANLAALSIIGNNTGSPTTPIALTETQVTAMLNVFTSSLQGVVPGSGGGTTNFLRADGTWAAPSGAASANQTLSNLTSPTSINQDLLPDTTLTRSLGSLLDLWSDLYVTQINSVANTLNILTGSSSSIATSPVLVASGSQSGTGATGLISLTSGNIFNPSNSANTGAVELITGNITSGTGASGNILLSIGTSTGTRGQIRFQDGSQGTSGYIWTSTDASGSGHWAAPAATGVTSVALADGSTSPLYAISGSPVTSTGTLTFTLNSQSANMVLASPDGSSGQPTMRSLVSADLPNLSAIYVTQSEVAAANGVASLDSGGKVPVAQLPSTVMIYKGAWDASTNTPTLADGTGTNGWVYRASVAGTQNLGSGSQTWAVGDFAIYNGSIWQHSPAADGVSSVNGMTGAVTINAINQLTGDITAGPASGSASAVSSLVATSNSTLVTLSSLSLPYSQVTGAPAAITALTGDASASGPGSAALTLATVNSSPGTYSYASLTVNGKGFVTSASAASTTGSGSVVLSASPTLTGTLSGAAANFSGNVQAGSFQGPTIYNTLVLDTGTSIAANTSAALYVKSNGNLGLATAANAASNLNFWALGLASGAVSSGSAPTIVTNGLFSLGSSDPLFNSLTVSLAVWLSDSTPGGITQTAPSTSGSANYKLGIAVSSNTILIDGKQLTGIS